MSLSDEQRARAERAEAALVEAKEYLKWTLGFIYQVCGVADWETMISDEGTEKARAKETEIRKWLAQPHGERAAKVIEAAIRYCEKGWKRALTSDSIREAELTGQDLRAAVDAYLAQSHDERAEGT